MHTLSGLSVSNAIGGVNGKLFNVRSNLLLIFSSKATEYFCRYTSVGVDGRCEGTPSSIRQGRL